MTRLVINITGFVPFRTGFQKKELLFSLVELVKLVELKVWTLILLLEKNAPIWLNTGLRV